MDGPRCADVGCGARQETALNTNTQTNAEPNVQPARVFDQLIGAHESCFPSLENARANGHLRHEMPASCLALTA